MKKLLSIVCVGVTVAFLLGCSKSEQDEAWTASWTDVKEFLVDNGVDLSADDYSWYADFCIVVRRYVHEKLTIRQVMVATDKLSDLFDKGIPGFMPSGFFVTNKEKIRTLIRAMEFIEETKGVLTYDEKEAFATCVWFAYCCRWVDSKTNNLMTFSFFKDFDKFDDLYKNELRNEYSDRFVRHEPGNSGPYGLSRDCPIQAISIYASHDYLGRLYPTNTMILFSCERIGSTRNSLGNLIDMYEIKLNDLNAKTNSTISVYVDPYCELDSTNSPHGFLLTDEVNCIWFRGSYKKMLPPRIASTNDSATILGNFYGVEFPFVGGWGYDQKTAVEITKSNISTNELDSVIMDFVKKRTYYELITLPTSNNETEFSGIEWDLEKQTEFEQNDYLWIQRDYTVSSFPSDDWDMLKNDWEQHGAYKNDEQGRTAHNALRASKQVFYRTRFVFKILKCRVQSGQSGR